MINIKKNLFEKVPVTVIELLLFTFLMVWVLFSLGILWSSEELSHTQNQKKDGLNVVNIFDIDTSKWEEKEAVLSEQLVSMYRQLGRRELIEVEEIFFRQEMIWFLNEQIGKNQFEVDVKKFLQTDYLEEAKTIALVELESLEKELTHIKKTEENNSKKNQDVITK